MVTAKRSLAWSLGVLLFVGSWVACAAQEKGGVNYSGKQIQFLIGTGAGDSYDLYSRLIGVYLTKYLPGRPTVVPVNQPGAGSLVAVNTMYNDPEGDVLAMGQRFLPLMPLLDLPGAHFDPLKMAYIGSMSRDISVCIVHQRTGIKSVAEARGKQIIVGTMGAGTELSNFTSTISHLLGINFKVVRGYGSSGEIDLAIDRGELQGRCGVSWSSLTRMHPVWLAKGVVKVILQISLDRSLLVPNVPALGELVSPRDRAALRLLLAPGLMARPIFGPPSLGQARLAMLRRAFDQAMADPQLRADAAKQRLDILDPMKGQAMQNLIAQLYASDPSVVRRARELVGAL